MSIFANTPTTRILYMAKQEYIDIFHSLTDHAENEIVEFKKAERNFDTDDLGKYFSALSNEANLRGVDFAWLVMGYPRNAILLKARLLDTILLYLWLGKPSK